MALHSISEAARLTGKARSTIHRHIKDGKLSKLKGKDGKPAIETSELTRVYGELSHEDSVLKPIVIHPATLDETPKIHALEKEVEALKTERDNLANERDKWAAQAERLTLLLTNDVGKGVEQGRRVGWFDRLLGRS